MADKKFYWIKLNTNFFEQDAIDYILSTPNGSEYIALYLKLCTMTANNNGKLATQIGEMLIPYDVNKIARDTKYFTVDTVIVALELFKKLGLIFESENNVMQISNYENMVGSSKTDENTKRLGAERQRRYREKQKMIESSVTVTHDVTSLSNGEIRDKSLDIRDIDNRDKEIEKENVLDKPKPHTKKSFIKPTLDDVKNYINEMCYHVDAERFYDYYESNGWLVGKNKMKDWKATVRNWERKEKANVVEIPPQLDSKFMPKEEPQKTKEELQAELEKARQWLKDDTKKAEIDKVIQLIQKANRYGDYGKLPSLYESYKNLTGNEYPDRLEF